MFRTTTIFKWDLGIETNWRHVARDYCHQLNLASLHPRVYYGVSFSASLLLRDPEKSPQLAQTTNKFHLHFSLSSFCLLCFLLFHVYYVPYSLICPQLIPLWLEWFLLPQHYPAQTLSWILTEAVLYSHSLWEQNSYLNSSHPTLTREPRPSHTLMPLTILSVVHAHQQSWRDWSLSIMSRIQSCSLNSSTRAVLLASFLQILKANLIQDLCIFSALDWTNIHLFWCFAVDFQSHYLIISHSSREI